MGGLNHGKITLYQWEGEPGGFFRDSTMDSFIGPISGGSDAGDSAVRDTERAPHTPRAPRPGGAVALRERAVRLDQAVSLD